MDLFMKKLRNNGYKKETISDEGCDINATFIDKELESYGKLLKSEILKSI